MVIYFISSNKRKVEARGIANIIKGLGHDIVYEAIGNEQKNDTTFQFDGMIADIQEFSVGVNYQIVLALSDKKPVMCIYSEGSQVAKNLPPAKGVIAKNLSVKTYTKNSLSHIIEEFIEGLNTEHKAERFNFFLTPDLKKYIDWVPYGTGMTKSNFIRQLIHDRMKGDDTYRSFVKKKK